MNDQEATVRRPRVEDAPEIVDSAGFRPFAEDGRPWEPGPDPDPPRRHGRAAFTAGLQDPARLLLAALYGGEVVGYLSGPCASRRGNRARCAPR